MKIDQICGWRGRGGTAALVACILQIWAFGVLADGGVGPQNPDSKPLTRLLGATFKITNKDSAGTCFMIEPPPASGWSNDVVIVVTTAHALEEAPETQCQILMRENGADGTFNRREVFLPIRTEGKPLWVKHPHEDVAAFKGILPPGLAYQPVRLEQLARAADFETGKVELGGEVWVYCFPVQLEANSAGFPIVRHGSIASLPLPPLASNGTFLVDFTTFKGDSGAPVIIKDGSGTATRPMIAGMVTAMHRQTDRTTMPFEERTLYTPMGLSIVVHSEVIYQTVELLLKNSELTDRAAK